MRKHKRNERTRYEFAVTDPAGKVVYTIWFMRRLPSLQSMYNIIVESMDAILVATGADDITWNGDRTITAGAYTGKMTGNTLLRARGYDEKSYQ